MNEAETRAELIDPKLTAAGWGAVEQSKVRREYKLTMGRIEGKKKRGAPLSADYVLEYKGKKLAVIEAKARKYLYTEGLAQAKQYAQLLGVRFAYATNGEGLYCVDMQTGREEDATAYPSPQALWERTFPATCDWRERFAAVPFHDKDGSHPPRYYQERAVERVLEAIGRGQQRALLTLATGTGKTFVAFQIAWRLFESRWNLSRQPTRRPRILFLADRNILADQAYNAFSAFPDDALVRVRPEDIRKKGRVPTNGSVFFTIFQTFMSGTNRDQEDEGQGGQGGQGGPPSTPYFGEYPPDFFDIIIIDECHRGGASDESTWRAILDYFKPAVQLGLTATPKRKDNVDTYAYFGEPVDTYSLKDGINDGFLTPFRLKQISSDLDTYTYNDADEVLAGDPDPEKTYTESDFNRRIEIRARELARVKLFMSAINQGEKTLVFCGTQRHAALVRDLINQEKTSKDPNYCVRVAAADGEIGEQFLRMFQDNEKSIPTILTTSQKLSTGVDARNVRNIVLMRRVGSMIEFKQIVGRGTRLHDEKAYFTIYDFVKAHEHFNDPEWDGEPLAPKPKRARLEAAEDDTAGAQEATWEDAEDEDDANEDGKGEEGELIQIALSDGRARKIKHQVATTFWHPDGKPMTAQAFLEALFGALPTFFQDEEELRTLWSAPSTRQALLEKLEASGFGEPQLCEIQHLIDADQCDLFDVLAHVAYATQPQTRAARVEAAKADITARFKNDKQRAFIDFVLSHYLQGGVAELASTKLRKLLDLKYKSITDAQQVLGKPDEIRAVFSELQRSLYRAHSA